MYVNLKLGYLPASRINLLIYRSGYRQKAWFPKCLESLTANLQNFMCSDIFRLHSPHNRAPVLICTSKMQNMLQHMQLSPKQITLHHTRRTWTGSILPATTETKYFTYCRITGCISNVPLPSTEITKNCTELHTTLLD
jgi:hypothetical protein